jgi:adenylate cyclase
MTDVIGRYNSVVTQFQGDAIMATFNVPLEDGEHAANAVRAALEMLDLTGSTTFDAFELSIRTGTMKGHAADRKAPTQRL